MAGLIAGAGLILYLLSAAPTVLWGDDAELQRIAITGEARAIGQSSAASHLLWQAVAMGFVRSTTWLPVDTLLLATSLWVMLRAGFSARPILWWVAGLATVVLAMTNHVMILASVPGLVVLGVAGVRVRARTVMWPGMVSGLALLMMGIFASMAGFPIGALVRAIVSYRPYLPSFRDIALVPVYLVYQFPVALILVFWAGRPLVRCGIATVLGIALTYSGVVGLMLFRFHPEMYVRDQFLFYLPSYVPVAILIGLGAGELSQRPAVMTRLHGWRGPVLLGSILLAPLVVYPVATLIAGGVATKLAPSRVLPGRDPVSYYLWPPKTGYTGAREYAEAAFGALPRRLARSQSGQLWLRIGFLTRCFGTHKSWKGRGQMCGSR
ncbi:MAG: hypothetical protein EBS94_16055 [Proteobacteria bacterium]|nr:hypothetical protein [Pseudomonadota bacterium]